MKKIAALIFLFAFAAQTFSRGLIFVDFYLNQSSIAAKKCENRYRPMLHCNGKCQLAKKLKQQEKKDEQNPERKLENKNETVFSLSLVVSCLPETLLTAPDYNVYRDEKTIDRSVSVFHPPCS